MPDTIVGNRSYENFSLTQGNEEHVEVSLRFQMIV